MRMNIIKWDESIYHRYIHRFPCTVHKKGSSSKGGKHKEEPTDFRDTDTTKSISCNQTDNTDIHIDEKCCSKNTSSDSNTALNTVPATRKVCEWDSVNGIGVGQTIECDIIYGCISDL